MTKHISTAQPITLYILKSSTPNTFNMTRLVYNGKSPLERNY